MHKYLLVIILLFQPLSVYANSTESIKMAGHTLSNYQACETLSQLFYDPVMAYYYHDMQHISRIENEKMFSLIEVKTIEDEYISALSILNKLNQTSLYELCLSRFDAVSRQHYKTQFNKTIN